jgi:hypothetical protein
LVNALYREFDVASVFNKITEELKQTEEIGKQNELTHEQYSDFLKKGIINQEDWEFNGKGWVNVTSGMAGLVEALKANTIATYNLTVEEAKKQKEIFESVGQYFGEDFV